MKIQDFLDSGFIGKTTDKLKGSSVGIDIRYSGSYSEVSPDSYAEKARQDVSRLTGKKIWSVVKGKIASMEFLFWAVENKPDDVIYLGEGYYEVPFEEFSIYGKYSKYHLGIEVLMDAKEVILPPKSTATLAKLSRTYVLSRADSTFHYYLLPYLNYPNSLAPFIKWLGKKKKLVIKDLVIWNKDQNIYKSPGAINLITWGNDVQADLGAPMRNIKTEDDLNDYNEWLEKEVGPDLEKAKASDPGGSALWEKMVRCFHCPTKIDVVKVDITQSDIDDYIKEVNGPTFKVIR